MVSNGKKERSNNKVTKYNKYIGKSKTRHEDMTKMFSNDS